MIRALTLLLCIGLTPAMGSERPLCSSLTDTFCDQLWKTHKGNMKVPDGQVAVGNTPKSEMTYVQKANFEAWIQAEGRLPRDLRKRVRPALRELKQALARENDSKEWYTQIAIPSYRLDLAVDETVQERVEKKWPELRTIRSKDRTFAQNRRYMQEATRLRDQIVTAQYKNHPHWKRVERIFKIAQQDILSELDQLTLTPGLREQMKTRVKSIRLTLPLLNPADTAINDTCQKTEINSYYFPSTHTFTVCAGYFNAFATDAGIYLSTAHEIAHSIDPSRMATLRLAEESAIFKQLQKLKGSKVPAFPCDEWEKIRQNLSKLRPEMKEPPKPELAKLFNCLIPNPEQKPFNTENVRQASSQEAVLSLDAFVTPNLFTYMAQPTIEKEGKTLPNEFFLDPTLMRASYNHGFDVTTEEPFVWLLDVFAQNYACEAIKGDKGEITYKTADPSHQRILFEQSIRNAQGLNQALVEEWYSFCGRTCPELTRYGLSKDIRENFSDWMAIRALAHFISREKDVEKRRLLSALASANLCEFPSPVASAPHLTAIEKTFSLEAHPDNRIRRVSVYTNEIAELVDCEIDDDIKGGFGMCEP